MNTELRIVKILLRVALGIVWPYEAVVPKLLLLRQDEIDLVQNLIFFCEHQTSLCKSSGSPKSRSVPWSRPPRCVRYLDIVRTSSQCLSFFRKIDPAAAGRGAVA